MTNEIVVTQPTDLEVAGQLANVYAGDNAFTDYINRKATNTIQAQAFDLTAFTQFLTSAGIMVEASEFQRKPQAWQGITWGLVEGFMKWQLREGFAIGTVNRRLSTIKTYAKLAARAGVISPQELTMIRSVSGYGSSEAKRVDTRRTVSRVGNKKAEHTRISEEQAQSLKTQPDTPQGRRDCLLMCLLLDHGLRCGEVVRLTVTNINLTAGTIENFIRPKVNKEQNHKMSADTLRAAFAWFYSGDAPKEGKLLRGSRKGGTLTHAGLSETAASMRVKELGERIGLSSLSAHDCRHYWATKWASKVDTLRLQEAGGWNSLSMPRRYIERSKIANEGMQ